MADQIDPWDWTPDQVVEAFCHKRDLWQIDRPHSALPEPKAFEAALRDQDVNGSTLLCDVAKETLKDDFQVTSLGQRSSIIWAIDQLRKRSTKYAAQFPSPSYASFNSTTSNYYASTPYPYTPLPGPTSHQQNIFSPPPSGHQDPRPPDDGRSPGFLRPSLPERSAPLGDQSPLQAAHGADQSIPGDAASNKRRAGESLIEDGTGRKKRRLNLTIPPSEGNTAAVSNADAGAGRPSALHKTSNSTAISVVGTSNTNTLDLRSRIAGLDLGQASYLGKNKLTSENIFFGQTKCGKVLNSDVSMTLFDADGPIPGHSFSFSAGRATSVLGRQSFIHQKLLNFMQQRPDLELATSDNTLAYYAYPASSSTAADPRTLVHLAHKGDDVVATRQTHSKLQGLEPGVDIDSTSSKHEWDFLKHWQQNDGIELPAYGESDSEPDSELDALHNEMEADREEDENAAEKVLSAEEVATIMDEVVADQVSIWREKRLPVLQDKESLSIWKGGKTSAGRQQLVALARQAIVRYDSRLESVKAQIMRERWEARRPLRKQCESFELTVRQREEERFRVEVWQRGAAPAPPSGKLRTQSRRKTHVSHDHAEHMIDDDDEELFIDDRLAIEEFVHIDDVEVVDLTNVLQSDVVQLDVPTNDHDGQQKNHDATDDTLAHVEGIALDATSDAAQKNLTQEEPESDSLLGRVRNGVNESAGKNSGSSGVDEGEDDEIADETMDETADESVGDAADKTADETGNKAADPIIKTEPRRPGLSSEAEKSRTVADIIDLTMDSDDDEAAARYAPPGKKASQAATQNPRYSSSPENDSDEQVAEWDWFDLEENEDRRRIIIKLIRTMPLAEYKQLREHVLIDNGNTLRPQIYEIAETAREILRKSLGRQSPFEVAQHAYERADEVLHLYACWLESSSQYFRQGHDSFDEAFVLVTLGQEVMEDASNLIEEDDGLDFLTCLEFVHDIFSKHAGPLGEEMDADSDVQEVDREEVEQESQLTPRKQRRKRAIAESQFAVNKRIRNRTTAKAWEDRSKMFLSKQQDQSSDLAPLAGDVVVNIGKEDNDEAIIINAYLAGQLKPHQIEGIRFLWREVVGTADDSDDTQGCLLAHTMGLGKTLQVIAFLTTLAQAAKDSDPEIREQIPKKLRNMRILILCPAGLVSNWIDEFAKWNKHRAGITESFVITSTTPASHRLPMLDKWYRKARGSVLIMGYELFRSWALNPSGKRQPFTEDEHKEVKEKLLRGPSIIIADEAHKLKNNESQITKAAKLLRTKSRIALTGSPLSNNLLEYFAMVDWIAPGYLGELVEFKANYVEPIEEGGYLDSTQADRRRARVKRAALIEILEPKIHRKEIDALQGILQAKIQFVLKVPSTEVQTQIYRAFVKLASPGIRDDSVSNAKLWGMMAYLQLLCSHPALFKVAVDSIKRKQLAHQQKKRAKSPIKRVVQLQDEGNRSPAIDDNDTDCSDEMIDDAEDGNPSDLGSLEVAEQVLSELADVFAPILENPLEVDFSNKAKLLLEIVQKSKAVKDKLLIFSHRLHTLDHLSKILDKAGVTWARLDGSTTMNKRQEMTKNFNKDDSCDVFLISTRAGGVGFNLHGANRVVLFDFSFNPTWEEQAIGRAFRLGQKKPVFVYRFISAGTFEDALFNQTVFKLQLAQQVVEKKNTRNKAVRIRDYIKMPQKSHLESLSEGIGHDKILDEIIENMVAGSELIHDLKLDTTFKEEDKETLDEVSRLEMEALVKENQLRNADPEAYRAQMAAKLYGHPSTARAASFNPALAGAATGMYAGFPSTAPMAQMVHPPARSMSSALNVPTAARFPCTGGSNGEPHGLPFASVPSFSIGGRAEPSPLSASTLPGATQNDTTQAQQNSQN